MAGGDEGVVEAGKAAQIGTPVGRNRPQAGPRSFDPGVGQRGDKRQREIEQFLDRDGGSAAIEADVFFGRADQHSAIAPRHEIAQAFVDDPL